MMHLVDVFCGDQWWESSGTFNHQFVIKHLDEDIHILEAIRPVNASVHKSLIPSCFWVFGRTIEDAVISQTCEFSELRSQNGGRLLQQTRYWTFNRYCLNDVVVLAGLFVLAINPKKADLAAWAEPNRIFGECECTCHVGFEIVSLKGSQSALL